MKVYSVPVHRFLKKDVYILACTNAIIYIAYIAVFCLSIAQLLFTSYIVEQFLHYKSIMILYSAAILHSETIQSLFRCMHSHLAHHHNLCMFVNKQFNC